MTTIIDLISFEEGYRDRPYLCSEGYPTVGYGFKLGPKVSQANRHTLNLLYDFTLPREAGDVWLECLLLKLQTQMMLHPGIRVAYTACANAHPYTGWDTNPRIAVLQSMAYQMGIDGLADFKYTLAYVAAGRFDKAAGAMLRSKWAEQTPNRARRHAEQMRTGQWAQEYGK